MGTALLRWQPVECPEQLRIVLVIARTFAGIASRPDAGRAIQRVDLEPGVVRERRQARGFQCRPRFDRGVRLERVAVLDRGRAVVPDELVRPEAITEDAPQLDDLVRVVGRENEGGHTASVAAWISVSRAAPLPANSSKASSSRLSNGAPSAVPCTSTNRPRPVFTMFMSTSAPESSS